MYISDEDIEPPSPDIPSQDGLRLHPARIATDNFIAPWGVTPRGKMERMRALRHEDPFIYEADPIVEDSRFHNLFQAGWYNYYIMPKARNPILQQKFVN